MSQRKSKVTNIKEVFFQHETPEMSYVLGFLLADGHLCKKGNSVYVANTQRSVIDYIQSLVGGNVSLQKPRKNGYKVVYRVCWYNKPMVNDLKQIYDIVHDKSYTGIWPALKDPFNLPHLIRGFLDGDGCIWNGRYAFVEVKSASKQLLEGYSNAVYELIDKRVKVCERNVVSSKIYQVVISGIHAKHLLEKVYISGYFGLKSDKVKEILSRTFRTKGEVSRINMLNRWRNYAHISS